VQGDPLIEKTRAMSSAYALPRFSCRSKSLHRSKSIADRAEKEAESCWFNFAMKFVCNLAERRRYARGRVKAPHSSRMCCAKCPRSARNAMQQQIFDLG
jgi:hypothetical protein